MTLCTICHQPIGLDEGSTLLPRKHVECALEQSRAVVAARCAADQRREERAADSRLNAAVFAATRRERAANVETLRALAAAEREAGLHATLAATRDAHAQRAAALELAATKIEEGP